MSRINAPNNIASTALTHVFAPVRAVWGGLREAQQTKEPFLKTIFVRPVLAYLKSSWRGELVLLGGVAALSATTYLAESRLYNRPNGGLTSGVILVQSQTKPVITGNMLSPLENDSLVIKFKYDNGKTTSFGVLVGKPRIEAGSRMIMDATCMASPEQAVDLLRGEKARGEEIIAQAKSNPGAIDSGDIRQYVATTWSVDISRPYLNSSGQIAFRVEANVRAKKSELKGIPQVDVSLLESSITPMTGTTEAAAAPIEMGRFLSAENLANALGHTSQGQEGYKPVKPQTLSGSAQEFATAHPTSTVSNLAGLFGAAMLFAQKRMRGGRSGQ